MKKRLEFECWNCKKTYSLLREIEEGNPILLVACPFCGKAGKVDLNPFRKPVDLIHKGGSPQDPTEERVYDLPDILPTEPQS